MKIKMSTGTFSPETVMFEYQHNTEKIIANMFWLCKQQVEFNTGSEESLLLSNFNYHVFFFKHIFSFILHWS
jgi:nitrous oxidase accessory protein NosD